jgi:type II secretory pathway component GspD/PulD (secretin)
VIEWVAGEAGLALQFSELPTGSFTYNDAGVFTPNEAINRVNLFLIPKGFALVRSGNLLSAVNLSDPRSLLQLDAIAELVTPDQLATLPSHDVVKCLFRLQELKADDAVDELSSLQLMTQPSVLSNTNQIMITDTAAKLLSVKAILDSFTPATMNNGTVVKSWKLNHVDAEDVLTVARPHLGLATGEMIGIDVSLSSDVLGKNLFATGVADKIKVIEGLVNAIDQPDPEAQQMQRDSILKSHLVEGGNVRMVYDVLQTLLAGQSVRLSIDEKAGSIVVLADAATQREIEMTVAELQATDAAFEVIQLNTIDPYYAISLLEEMLDLPTILDDDKTASADVPKIDADAGNRRLFVRAKKPQMEQIKKIISDLEAVAAPSTDSNFRVLSLPREQSERILQTATQFWRAANPITQIPTSPEAKLPTERVPSQANTSPVQKEPTMPSQITPQQPGLIPSQPSEDAPPPADDRSISDASDQSFTNLTHMETTGGDTVDNSPPEKSPILWQVTERGLLLHSDDTEALNRFEELIRVITGPTVAAISAPIVFYMQYMKADDALRMVARLLDGGDSAGQAEMGTLVNGYISAQSSFLSGSFLSTSEGTLTLTRGAMTVVADTRLNRLIAQGSADEISKMEDYLKIVDKPQGVTDVLTYGQSRVIELVNIKAIDAAEVIRESFGSRVASDEKDASAGRGASAAPVDPRQSKTDVEAQKLAAMAKASQPKDLAPKMTVAVHEASNSLVVTAPESLLAEVETLVRLIDSRGEQSIEIVAPSNVLTIEAALEGMLIETSRSRSSSSSSKTSKSK